MSGRYFPIRESRSQTKPLLSVVIPIHNAASTVEATLQSALKAISTLDEPSEIVLVDDGSKDSSLEKGILLLEDRNAEYIALRGTNSGVSRARNCGLEVARGDFVHFLDADDLVEPPFYGRCLLNQRVDLVLAGFTDLALGSSDSRYRDPGPFATPDRFLIGFLLESRSVWLGAAIFRRAHLEHSSLRFPLGIRTGEDQYFLCQALNKARALDVVRTPMVHHLLQPASVTTNKKTDAFDSYMVHRKLDRMLHVSPSSGTLRLAARLKRGRELIRMVRWARKTPGLYRLLARVSLVERVNAALYGAAHAALNRAIPHMIASVQLINLQRWVKDHRDE